MAQFQTLAGSVVSLSAGLPATFDALGYAAMTYTAVGLVESIPSFGKTYNLVTFSPVAERGTLKAKGGYDNGSGDLVFAIKKTDGGQIILEAASDSDDSYTFSFTFQDGRIQYSTGLVMGFMESNGTTEDVMKATSTIEFDRDFLEVPAP